MKKESLKKYLIENSLIKNDAEISEGYRDSIFEVDNMEFLVVDESERDAEYKEYQENLIDDLGLDAFVGWAKDYILNNCIDQDWFKSYFEEYYESYIEDIKFEGERLREEMEDAEVETEEEFLNYLMENIDDYAEEFEFAYGNDVFIEAVKENDLLNMDKVIDFTLENDGYGNTLSGYDGEEIELDNNLYAYRLN